MILFNINLEKGLQLTVLCDVFGCASVKKEEIHLLINFEILDSCDVN